MLALFRCASPTGSSESSPAVGVNEEAVVAGVPVRGLAAVGAIILLDTDGTRYPYCTATLVAPGVVLTAKHCLIVPKNSNWPKWTWGSPVNAFYKAFFVTGDDRNNPTHSAEIVEVLAATPDEGGMLQSGSDVAVGLLISPIKEVSPLPCAAEALDQSNVGQKAVFVGWGLQDNTSDLATERAAGSVTLGVFSGSPVQATFPDLDTFAIIYTSVDEWTRCKIDAECRANWEERFSRQLLQGAEVWTFRREGDGGMNNGDSGGPLLQKFLRDGKEQVMVRAVASGWGGGGTIPQVAGIFALLGASAQAIIATGSAWHDPCVVDNQVLHPSGVCVADVVTRCTLPLEGPRSIVTVDCSALGQACAMNAEGRAVCDDAPPAAPAPTHSPADVHALLHAIEAFFTTAH
jgi:hypothetical protein